MTMIGQAPGTYGRSILRTVGETQQVERVFQDQKVVNFWNVYGKELDNLAKAREAGAGVEAGAQAFANLEELLLSSGQQQSMNLFVLALKMLLPLKL
jgi:hypothetical protein